MMPKFSAGPGAGLRAHSSSGNRYGERETTFEHSAPLSDDDLQRLSATNPGWQFERSDDGALLVSPTDGAIEVASKTDEWPLVTLKIGKYISDGAGYAIAIDPRKREIYERGVRPVTLVLDTAAIIDA